MKIKYNPQNLKWYLILIPFLYPRGFSEYFILCKQIMTCWLYIAIAGIAIYFVETNAARAAVFERSIFSLCRFYVNYKNFPANCAQIANLYAII